MKHYLKKRPWNFTAVVFAAAGFWLQYRAFDRVASLFDEGSLALGFGRDQMTWLAQHQGQLGVACLAIAAAFYVKDHHNETRP